MVKKRAHLDSLWPCDVAGQSYFQQAQSSLMPIPNLSKCSFSTGNTVKQDLKASILLKDGFVLHAVPAHLHLSPFSMFFDTFSQHTFF